MSEQINRAIEYLEGCYLTASQALEVEQARYHNQCLETAVQALQSEFDRQENKALTLGELEGMVGKKVYRQAKLDVPQEIKINEIFKNNMIEIHLNCGRGVLIDFDSYNFYKHKPTEGVGR